MITAKKTRPQKKLSFRLLTISLFLVSIFSFYGRASGATWYVNGDISTSGDGTNWNSAFLTIHEAVSGASNGDEIWIKEGTYSLSSQVNVDKTVVIYGGFAGDETQRNQRDWATNVTTVDGQNSVYHCFYITSDATIDGITITGGNANGSRWPYNAGGGVLNDGSSPTITNCIFSGNSAKFAGGIRNWQSSPIITNCIFSGNSAVMIGGGIENDNSSPIITNCTFTGNSANSTGGAIRNWKSSPIIMNCILWANTAPDSPEINNDGFSSPAITYSDVQGGYGGKGNINSDPLFVDPLNGNFHLQVTSPCIDKGNNSAPEIPNIDFEGNSRIIDGDSDGTAAVDMGADECAFIDTDNDGLPDDWEITYFGDISQEHNDDYDEDGLVNLEEYQTGTNPASGKNIIKPTNLQAAWQDLEIGMFFHFGMATYTGQFMPEEPADINLFNPEKLDTDQWMEAAKAIGAKYAIFTAKHCTGFLNWQSDLYPYSVKQSPWREGKGDIVKDFIDSCHKHKIKPGLYASVPYNAYCDVDYIGLVNWGEGGDLERQSEYVKIVDQMLTELWTRYGDLVEIWFDGGILPVEKGGPEAIDLLKKYQPKAMVFGGPAQTIRWVGNEKGHADYPCWATIGKNRSCDMLQKGDPNGEHWLPAEADVVLRGHESHQWFWKPGQDWHNHSLDHLMKIYYETVGRNCNLLLNANPDKDGLVPKADMKRYIQFGNEIKRRFGQSIAEINGEGNVVELTLPKMTKINHIITMEEIIHGERVRQYDIEGLASGNMWEKIGGGTCIGHKHIEKTQSIEVAKVRLIVKKAIARPIIRKLAVYYVKPNGDIAPLGDRDGSVTVGDALVALRFALGLETPTQEDMEHGDVAPLDVSNQPNTDGVINVGDALVILKKSLGTIFF